MSSRVTANDPTVSNITLISNNQNITLINNDQMIKKNFLTIVKNIIKTIVFSVTKSNFSISLNALKTTSKQYDKIVYCILCI